MTVPLPARGAAALRRVLEERTLDVRSLDPAGFRRWLALHLSRWERDALFARRCDVRALRRAHPDLRALEAAVREARAADAATPAASRLAELERELRGAAQAVAGLSAALEAAPNPERPALAAKLDRFRARARALEREQEEYTGSSPERQALLRLRAGLARLRERTGLAEAEAGVERLQRERGRGSTRHGGEFERTALALTRAHLLPGLAAGSPGRIEVLVGVTLGARDVEIDQLVARVPADASRPVEALAVVEAKRNPNDLGHGYRRRRLDLAWLRGDAGRYDPERYRNRRFPAGHFDRPVEHRQGGEAFLVAPGSFARLGPAPADGAPPDGLHLVAREGTLWGLSGAALGRVAHRAATDERWAPEDEGYLEELRAWCLSLAEAPEAPDVLRLHAAHPEAAERVLLVGGVGEGRSA